MTKDRAIDILNKTPFWERFTEEEYIAMSMAIDALKQTTWIPCSERLPEKSDDVVLVTVIEERRIQDIYMMRCNEVESAYIAKWISAWMPLPEPYMRGEEDE